MRAGLTVVRAEGLEPPRRCRHQDLNLTCLPIPPRPLCILAVPLKAQRTLMISTLLSTNPVPKKNKPNRVTEGYEFVKRL